MCYHAIAGYKVVTLSDFPRIFRGNQICTAYLTTTLVYLSSSRLATFIFRKSQFRLIAQNYTGVFVCFGQTMSDIADLSIWLQTQLLQLAAFHLRER